MKKLLRKNQIIITALVVMVALAGYLSLTDEEDLAVGVLNQSEQATGDEKDAAENVAAENGTGSAVQDDTVADISDEDVAAEEKKSDNEVSSKENAGEAVLVSNTVTGDYFEAAKLSREQTRAKNKETLLELVNSKDRKSTRLNSSHQ